jgi:hypothetical protein
LELELEEVTFVLLLETTALLDDDETFELLEVALLLETGVVEVDTGFAAVLGLIAADEDEVFFALEETGLLVDLAVVLEDEVDVGFLDEDVMVDFTEVTILTWVFKVVFAVLFFVEDDFFLEEDFLVEVVLCVELECLVTVLVTARSTSSTLQDPDSGLHSTARSISVVSAGDTLPATAETSSRAKAEMVEMLRIVNKTLNECK